MALTLGSLALGSVFGSALLAIAPGMAAADEVAVTTQVIGTQPDNGSSYASKRSFTTIVRGSITTAAGSDATVEATGAVLTAAPSSVCGGKTFKGSVEGEVTLLPATVNSLREDAVSSLGGRFVGTIHGSSLQEAGGCRAKLTFPAAKLSLPGDLTAGDYHVFVVYSSAYCHINVQCDGAESVPSLRLGGGVITISPPAPDSTPVAAGTGPDASGTSAGDSQATSLHGPLVSSLSHSVATARDVHWKLAAVLGNALLALLLVVLMPFPAALFNATLESNYDRVRRRLRGLLPSRGSAAAPVTPGPTGPSEAAAQAGPTPVRRWPARMAALVGLTALVALLNALLDPHVTLGRPLAVLLGGLFLSSLVITLVSSTPAGLYLRRRHGHADAAVSLFPLGLLIAALCVLMSRLGNVAPGYLYGVIAGVAFTATMSTRLTGRLALTSAAALLVLSLTAMLVRSATHGWVASHGNDAPVQVLDTTLAALAAAGIDANVIGLLPITFMAGQRLFAWSRVGWGTLYGLSVFGFLQALSTTAEKAGRAPAIGQAALLFVTFALISGTFWGYFRARPTKPAPATSSTLQQLSG